MKLMTSSRPKFMPLFRPEHRICFFAAVAALAFLFADFLCAAQDRDCGYAIVDVSAAFLRAEADYESPLETQEFMGAVVEVVGRDGYWVKVRTSQPYTAWCNEKCLAFVDSVQAAKWSESRKYMVVAPFSRIYSRPDKSSSPVSDLCRGDLVRTCLHEKSGKAVVSGKWAEVSVPGGRTGWTLRADIVDYGRWRESLRSRSEDAVRQAVVKEAEEWTGVPYLWGGMSPKAFDCSGLVRFVYYMNGILLPRNASQQVKCGVDVPVYGNVGGEAAKSVSGGTGEFVSAVAGEFVSAGAGEFVSGRAGKSVSAGAGEFVSGGAEKSVSGEAGEFVSGGAGESVSGRAGKSVSGEAAGFCADALLPGDLLFFGTPASADRPAKITHVGIYVGGGRMIHSSQLVRRNSLCPQDPDCYENAWRLLCARRIIGCVTGNLTEL